MSCAQQELARIQEEEAVSSAQERADLEVLLPFFKFLDIQIFAALLLRQKSAHDGRGLIFYPTMNTCMLPFNSKPVYILAEKGKGKPSTRG